MKLYFLRHGYAEDGSATISDHDRQLTPEGVRRMQTAAQVIARLNLKLTHIYSSPRVRAAQTAEIVAGVVGLTVMIRDEVNFDFDVAAVQRLVEPLNPADRVMFVGHNPSMSEVVQELSGALVEMKKGGLAMVELLSTVPPLGTLNWLLTPKIFDTLHDPR